MPGFISTIVQILNSAGIRVDQPSALGVRQPIALKLGAGLVGSSVDAGNGMTEVTVVTDTAGGALHDAATTSVNGFMSAADKVILNSLSARDSLPAPTFEAGAVTSLSAQEFNLAPVSFKANADSGTHDHLFDIGSKIPPGADANLLVDFSIHGFRESAGVKYGIGVWKKSATWYYTAGPAYLISIGESDLVKVDAGAHTYAPTVAAGTYSTNSHTVKLEIAAANGTDVFHFTIFARAQLTYYPGLA